MRLVCEHGRACAAGNVVAHSLDAFALTTQSRRRRPSIARSDAPLCTAAASAKQGAQPGPPALPLVEQCTLQDWRSPLPCWDRSAPPIVALGKFDALHKGHMALAATAARLGGTPTLLSFSGMAEVLGWEQRLPLIAPCDRSRVLQLWRGSCGGACPRQRYIPFDQIRSLSPAAFVEVLARDLRAAGVVAGSNYRFGYRASGDAAALQSLGTAAGLRVQIVDLVGSPEGTAVDAVSSSKIRDMLAMGHMEAVSQLLGRQYRLVAQLPSDTSTLQHSNGSVQLPSSCLLNQPPRPGDYAVAASTHAGASAESNLLELEQARTRQEAPSSSSHNGTRASSGADASSRGDTTHGDATSSRGDSRDGSRGSSAATPLNCSVHVGVEGVELPAAMLEGLTGPALLVLDFQGLTHQKAASNG